MTIYGTFDDQFRQRPALWRLAAVSGSLLLLCSGLVSLLVGATIGFTSGQTRFHRGEILDAPPLFLPGVLFDAAEATFPWFPQAVAGGALLLAVLVLWLWPTSQSLTAQLFQYAFGLDLAIFAILSPAITSALAKKPAPDKLMLIAPEAVAAIVAIVLLFRAESKLTTTLRNVLPVEHPSKRLGYWSIRFLPAMALLAGAAWFEGATGTLAATGSAIVLTGLHNLARPPRQRFEQLRHVEMREAAAVLPLLTLLLLGALWWGWGGPMRERRTLVWEKPKVYFTTPAEARRISGLEAPRVKHTVIRMEWAK